MASLNLQNSSSCRAVNAIAFREPARWALNESHFENLTKEIDVMAEGLPEHNPELEEWIVRAVRSQQPAQIVTVSQLASNNASSACFSLPIRVLETGH